MRRYQTEVIVPADRRVVLRVPDPLPEGRAIVTIEMVEPETVESGAWSVAEIDGQDIEWWDEFDEEGDESAPVLDSAAESESESTPA